MAVHAVVHQVVKKYRSQRAREAVRQQHLNELAKQYRQGIVSVDPDDPRTTRGLTSSEVRYVTGDSDDAEYDELKQNGVLYEPAL